MDTTNKVDFEKSARTSRQDSRSSSLGSPSPRQIEDRQSIAIEMPLEKAPAGVPPVDERTSSVREPAWPRNPRAYLCLISGFFLSVALMFNSWGLLNAQGTYQSYYNQHLLPVGERSLAWTNFLGATQCFIVLGLSGVVGRILDAGHIKWLIVIGSALLITSTFSLSAACGNGGPGEGNYWYIWLAQSVGSGLGMSCFFVSSSWVACTWFKETKSFAVGFVASGAAVAGLVYTMMFKFLLAGEGANFRSAQRWTSVLTALTCVVALLCCRPNPDHQKRPVEKWLRLETFVDMDAFKNRSFVFFLAAISFLFLGFYVVSFNLEEWAAYRGLGRRDEIPESFQVEIPNEVQNEAIRTFWLLAIMNICSILGRVSAGFFGDVFGAVKVHAVVTTITSLLCLLMWPFVTVVNATIAFVVIFGAFSGAVIGLPPASISDILGKDPVEQAKLGQWVGMLYTAAAIPAMIGPPVAGYLIEVTGHNFLTIQLWSGFCLLMAAICMAAAAMCTKESQILERLRRARRFSVASFVTFTTRNNSKETQATADV
ncbi:hypothetical protein B0A48_06801 [Cryoendolithus antarcticus]|uniref:Major facilitator superfamily (MFS) profile domain-containing protein n=1 Tax=Cryoendolithus antarcticus TaxID=1507870 RepID=A0A1V8T9U9_9PEZI|nr:hypothetical protein B0A48_06801 [Cryoendolithus antarcticus]